MFVKPNKLYRMFAILAAVFVFLGAVAFPAQAAGSPSFVIVSVTPDQSVRVRTYNFPANTIFTIRMDVVGNAGVNGIIVTQTNTGAGGSFEETYRIPAELRGKAQLVIRFESTQVSTYNWFNNVTSSVPSSPSVPVTGSGVSPKIIIVGVDKNDKVTIEAQRFPANTNFAIRIGPFYNFWKGGEVVGNINSGNGGTFRFTIGLPDVVDNVSLVSVRLDSANGYYAYNAFTNADSGTITPGTVTQNTCEIVSVSPSASLAPKADFDAVWKIKNTGDTTWKASEVDYRYLSGTKTAKYDTRYDLPSSVAPGKTITIRVDMLGPSGQGWYTTNWGLVVGSKTICQLPLTFRVK